MSYSDERALLVREFEQWYRTVPADVSSVFKKLSANQAKGAFEKKSALYGVAARELDIKIFRHFPFFFECNAGQSRSVRAGEGLSGYLLDELKPDEDYEKLRARLERLDLAKLPENPFVMNLETGAAHVITQGTQALKRQINQSAEKALARRRRDFCGAALSSLESIETLCARFTGLARHMAEVEIDRNIRANLERMGRYTIEQPAGTLFDAMQGFIFWREATSALEGANYPSLGALDEVLASYYDADIEAGRITPDEAVELLGYMLKYPRLRDKGARLSITLGAKPSAFTLLMLNALDDEILAAYSINVYTGTGDSDEYRRAVLEVMERGVTLLNRDRLGDNVEMVGDQAQRRGIETRLCDVVINLPAVLMGTLLPDKVEKWQGLHIDCYEGEFFAAEDIYHQFMDNLAALEQDIVSHLMKLMEQKPQQNPMLLQSVSMPDCIARARDITECGALSTSIVIGFDGLGVFLRALSSIKQLCYDTHRVPLCKIFSTLEANFEGDEPLYKLLSAPKKQMETQLMEKFVNNVEELFMAVSERPEISVRPSLLQVSRMGAGLMATPDGRFYGEGLESDMLNEVPNKIGGGVSCQWAPEDELQAEGMRTMFINSGAGALMLYME